MNYEYEIQNLKEKVANLQQTVIQMGKNTAPFESKAESAANEVKAITPYTETKTAYIGDTEVVFQNKQGNLLIYTDKPFPYSVDRNHDFIVVNFEPLEEVSQITISIQ